MKYVSILMIMVPMGMPYMVHSQELLADNIIAQGEICVGSSDCQPGESFDGAGIKIKNQNPQIRFVDSGLNEPDWRMGSDVVGALDDTFVLRDDTNVTFPFAVGASAPNYTLYLDPTGNIGMGTIFPMSELHIVDNHFPAIRFEDAGGTPYSWELGGNNSGIGVIDLATGRTPFFVKIGGLSDTLVVAENGQVGIGTDAPAAPLELLTSNTFSFFRISATGAAVNQSVDITFTGGPLGTGQLRYNIVDGDAQEMSLDADGNMVLNGTLTTTGPLCAGGCDAVFDDAHAHMSIEDHAELMFTHRYLPAVGPTVPRAPVNMTETMGKMLNELEHAHIYINQLHERLAEQEAKMATLLTRLKDNDGS